MDSYSPINCSQAHPVLQRSPRSEQGFHLSHLEGPTPKTAKQRRHSIMSDCDNEENPSWRQALNREFKVQRDLNKYTRDIYEQIDRKMVQFARVTARGRADPSLTKRAFVIQQTQIWEEDRASLQKIDWYHTPIYKHYTQAQESGSHLVKQIQSKYTNIYTLPELEYNIRMFKL